MTFFRDSLVCFGVYYARLAGAENNSGLDPRFVSFLQQFEKSYAGEELQIRARVFAENMEKVRVMNEEHQKIGGDAVFGVTQFSDLSEEEFRAQYLSGYVAPTGNTSRVELPPIPGGPLATVDWRNKGAVTPVKNQGQCGSCWAFSATAAIESYAHLSGKYPLTDLSTQQINACDHMDGGCNGGNTETAFTYVHRAGGIETNKNYPYTSGTGITGICKFKKAKANTTISGYTKVAMGESHLKTALNSGPPSVCVAAGAFQSYSGGILRSCPGSIDHCVQAVGYDDSHSPKYWIVRNSWGRTWGEQGYIRIEQGMDLCEIANDVSFPKF